MDEHRRAYQRVQMRARRARMKAGLDPAVGRGTIQAMTGMVRRHKSMKTVVPLGSGGPTAETDPTSKTYVLADGRRVRDRSRVKGRPRSENLRRAAYAERAGFLYRSNKTRGEVYHLDSGRVVPATGGQVSYCGLVPPMGSLVAIGVKPTDQTCRTCMRSLRYRTSGCGAGLTGDEYLAKKQAVKETLEALASSERQAHRGRFRAVLPSGREVRPLLIAAPVREREIAMYYRGEAEVKSVGSGGELRYVVSVPPPVVSENGVRCWRKRLDVDSARPVQYYATREEAGLVD